MKIENSTPIFDLVNHGFAYLCGMSDGTFWLRSVGGKWGQIDVSAVDVASLQSDMDVFMGVNKPATEDELMQDNAGMVVVEPIDVTIDDLS